MAKTQCTICNHPQRGEIEARVVQGEPDRQIANQYDVSASAIGRHRRKGHMAEVFDLSKQRQQAVVEKAVDDIVVNKRILLDKMNEQIAEAEAVLREARESVPRTFRDGEEEKGERWSATQAQQWTARLQAIGRLTSILELQAKMVGELQEKHVHLHTTPEWIDLQYKILEALEPYPEAKLAVAQALRDERDVTGT